MYSRFDITVTDEDPGTTPHIEAVIGGYPADVGLPDNVAGVSPFTEDCGIIEGSIVFTFANALPNDAQTYLDYDGNRTFQDDMASCGEFQERPCGINGSTCRDKQSSVQLLQQRVGKPATKQAPVTPPQTAGGCSTGRDVGLVLAVALAGLRRRRLRT
jgi:hypothetical protein